MPRDAEIDRYVERMGGALTEAGLPRLPSRVFAALTADDDGRMTADELAQALRVSKASISGAVKFLAQVSFIHREREPGSRRDVYVVDEDAWLNALQRTDQTYAPMIAALGVGLAAVDPESSAHRRLVLARAFLEFVTEEMDGIAQRWLARRADLEAGFTS
ncbi:MAG: MarR family transcriptional regulator [Nocardioidaceae bacterium]